MHRFRFHVLALFVVLSGCATPALFGQVSAIQSYNQQAQTNAAARAANAPKEEFVVVDSAWMCPTEEAALAAKSCAGGKEVQKNRNVLAIGEPKHGVAQIQHFDAQGEHTLYMVASALRDQPDIAALDAFERDVDKRFSPERRIPLRYVNFRDLVEEPAAYRGRFLVVRQPSSAMTNKDFANGKFTFTIPIAAKTGSRWVALAQFELANAALVKDFEAGNRSYECGPGYCDDFVIVAELSGRTVDRIDDLGQVHRIPVFTVRELGDRFGTYR